MKHHSSSESKVCMFVWNYFTNDARVTREARTLVKAGYQVWVIAVHDPLDPDLPKIETNDNINIIRVSRLGLLHPIRSTVSSWKMKLLSKKESVSQNNSMFSAIFVQLILSLYHLRLGTMHFFLALISPENAVVLYGQPNTGLVLIRVTEEKKKEVKKILKEMKPLRKAK